MKQVSLKLAPERCQCGGKSCSKWETIQKCGSIICKGAKYFFVANRSGTDRGCVIIYIFMEILHQTRMQIFVNDGFSFKSNSLLNREPV